MRGCNGICGRYKVKQQAPVKDKPWYKNSGIKRCGTCRILMKWAGTRCPCCKSVLGTNIKQRKSKQNVKRY